MADEPQVPRTGRAGHHLGPTPAASMPRASCQPLADARNSTASRGEVAPLASGPMPYLYEVVGRDERASFAWPRSKAECQRLTEALAAMMAPALDRVGRMAGRPVPSPERLMGDFLAVYAKRPLIENKGGSGLNDSLWLYAVTRLLAPALIVESGTWRGQSAWLFRQAAPTAEIHSFDVERPPEGCHETPGVSFHLRDWTGVPLAPPATAPALLFFDDHVSQARRLMEAAARGFRLALFDDNFPAEQLHATGAPPVPTLAMLLDEGRKRAGAIEWQRNGKIYRYHATAEHHAEARRLVEDLLILPELAPVTRHPPGSRMTMVRIASTARTS